MGNCYFEGRGVPKDETEAVKWWRKAAEHNNAKAQYNLGSCYYNGTVVPEDYIQSYKWLSLAGNQGDREANRNLIVLSAEMTAEQIESGRKLVREFKPRVEEN
jgi:TPR repeat protein